MNALEAILFDCDGVLADTERDGHRVAFNKAFEQKGLPTVWDEKLYGELLKVGGGKERMKAHWNEVGWPDSLPPAPPAVEKKVVKDDSMNNPDDEDEIDDEEEYNRQQAQFMMERMKLTEKQIEIMNKLAEKEKASMAVEPDENDDRSRVVREIHRLKTTIFQDMVTSGSIPLRPGVERLVDEAIAKGVRVAVCSTSNEESVKTIVKSLLGEERASWFQVFAGDIVQMKKPKPDIYLLATRVMGLARENTVVIEDSEIGLEAARRAGIHCLVTKSTYTKDEDFTGATKVVEDLESGGVTLETCSEILGTKPVTLYG
eukprot:CAMPEP_0116846070 /NCGR_PEP_ID=MMETSP0418-20121206/13631_1 /TAXON_ID=1158023 /ORGANISM="Astrosyne radiata, Strain 13vi08-1A" /LENGTH=315 /DNA_ID=CAMNT_0004477277 /DNA_START=175 /DNA_END=1122 /DNA_ORIENTATION=+